MRGATASGDLLHTLSGDERDRVTRFRNTDDADRYCTAHASLRILLARYLGVPRLNAEFRRSCRHCGAPFHGKPALDIEGALHFNLSTASGLIAMAFSRSAALGIDVESLNRMDDVVNIGHSILTAAEAKAVSRHELSERRRSILQCWVRKEAVLKASGHGLALDPRSIEVGWTGRRQVELLDGAEAATSHWTVTNLHPTVPAVAAIASSEASGKVVTTMAHLRVGRNGPVLDPLAASTSMG
jgi:4'-phosphopantetheinyl transferase